MSKIIVIIFLIQVASTEIINVPNEEFLTIQVDVNSAEFSDTIIVSR